MKTNMMKWILIYLWIYIGIYYVIEAADADEHVHIKLHMPRGQRKHNHQHHHNHHHTHHKKRQLPLHYNAKAPSLPPREPPPPQLYHETPQHNYLTGITTTSSTSPQQHYLQHTKKLPTSHLHDSIGQLLQTNNDDEDGGGGGSVDEADEADEEGQQHMQYLAENFALFPQPSTSSTYDIEVLPGNSHDFGQRELDEEDNEIRGLENGDLEEEVNYYARHRPYAEQTMKNEQQLLQQIFQQQQEQHQQHHNQFEQADIMKTAKLRANKYKRPEKEYHSEDDMTENMMYSSGMPHLTTTFMQGNNAKVDHHDSQGFKPLTVDDIWSQLQRQYLNKYVPQAQPLYEGGGGGDDDNYDDETSLKSTTKRKRTIIRQRPLKSTRQPTSSFWPAKTLNFENIQQPSNPQEDHHSYSYSSSSPSLSSFASSSSAASSSAQATELFDDSRAFRRPYNKFNGHNSPAHHHTQAGVDFHVANNEKDNDDDVRIQFNTDNVGDDDDVSFEESIHQRGKKYVGNTGHVAYGNSNVNNPFNYHDLYGAYSTPVTATVATKVHPSTYHPKLTRASSSSFYGDSVSPTLSHESTSYQWHTQQHNPDSQQTYHHSQHQQEPLKQQQQQQEQQQQQHLQQHQLLRFRQFQPPQSSALRLPKATITQMPSTAASTAISSTFASLLSPTIANDFNSSPATKSTPQPSRYKKRKNRIKTKKNRIVVV